MSALPLPDTAAPKRVLLVEDDRFLRKAAEAMLRKHGFQVTSAQDGEEGLRAARLSPPDIVLLDLIMPKMGGFQVLEALKADEQTRHLPVVIMSNLGQEADVQRAMDSGAIGYVVKANVALQDLVAKVERLLAEAA
jgi:CheY-like chemotaxis protein